MDLPNGVTIHWLQKNVFSILPLVKTSKHRVIMTGGFINNIRAIHLFKPSDYILNWIFSSDYETEMLDAAKILDVFGLNPKMFWYLCNEPEQVQIAKAIGFNAIFCSANCLLDENVYKITNSPKYYNAVSNSRLIKFKRVPLGYKIHRLLLLTGTHSEVGEYDSLPPLTAGNKVIRKWIYPEAILNYLNAAKVGVILSEREGACLASSEFLLCGLPVVSTPSKGGRSVFYNERNSFICEPTQEAVADAVKIMVRRLDNKEISAQDIRDTKVRELKEHRQRLFALLDDIFKIIGYDVSGEACFSKFYYNKIMHHDNGLSWEQVQNELK